MSAMALDYLSAISTAMLRSGALPGASEDLTRRILRDLPTDISAYLATCQKDLPMYFTAAPAAAAPTPQRGEPTYDQYFLAHLAEVAGPLVPAVAASPPQQRSGTSDHCP